ncbi:MAG: uL13 family ribosomal protein [Candidatus Hodgkinia cicadicola]
MSSELRRVPTKAIPPLGSKPFQRFTQSDLCVLDLAQQSLGRMLSIAAKWLIISSETSSACKLIFVNPSEAKHNDRLMRKCYWRHSGYPGGIKCKLASSFDREQFILKVLRKMLPRKSGCISSLSRISFTSSHQLPNLPTELRFIATSN